MILITYLAGDDVIHSQDTFSIHSLQKVRAYKSLFINRTVSNCCAVAWQVPIFLNLNQGDPPAIRPRSQPAHLPSVSAFYLDFRDGASFQANAINNVLDQQIKTRQN